MATTTTGRASLRCVGSCLWLSSTLRYSVNNYHTVHTVIILTVVSPMLYLYLQILKDYVQPLEFARRGISESKPMEGSFD